MLENWLAPLAEIPEAYEYENWQIGHHIIRHQESLPDLHNIKCVIVGLDDQNALPIRKALFAMSLPWKNARIADLGNIRNDHPDFVLPLLELLRQQRICVILIGGQFRHLMPQVLAFRNQEEPIQVALFDERIRNEGSGPLNTLVFNKLFELGPDRLQNIAQIGWQQAYTPMSGVQLMHDRGFETFRLGTAQSDRVALEPILRDTDMMCIHTAVLHPDLVPGGELKTSAVGFSLAEICQLARYASHSHRIMSMQIMGYNAEKDTTLRGAEALANLLWYMFDGVINRAYEYPSVEGPHWQQYVVNNNGDEIIFWRSSFTHRWWMEVQLPDDKRRFIPCSATDYETAGQGEIPPRLFTAMRRYDL